MWVNYFYLFENNITWVCWSYCYIQAIFYSLENLDLFEINKNYKKVLLFKIYSSHTY